jgi:hypothetical protein
VAVAVFAYGLCAQSGAKDALHRVNMSLLWHAVCEGIIAYILFRAAYRGLLYGRGSCLPLGRSEATAALTTHCCETAELRDLLATHSCLSCMSSTCIASRATSGFPLQEMHRVASDGMCCMPFSADTITSFLHPTFPHPAFPHIGGRRRISLHQDYTLRWLDIKPYIPSHWCKKPLRSLTSALIPISPLVALSRVNLPYKVLQETTHTSRNSRGIPCDVCSSLLRRPARIRAACRDPP